MKEDRLKPTDWDPEIRITAYLLGELSPEEALEVERRLSADPALRAWRDRLSSSLGLIREAVSSPDRESKGGGDPRVMSRERRAVLLQTFKGVGRVPQTRWGTARHWIRDGLSLAAMVAVLAGFAAVIFAPPRSKTLWMAKVSAPTPGEWAWRGGTPAVGQRTAGGLSTAAGDADDGLAAAFGRTKAPAAAEGPVGSVGSVEQRGDDVLGRALILGRERSTTPVPSPVAPAMKAVKGRSERLREARDPDPSKVSGGAGPGSSSESGPGGLALRGLGLAEPRGPMNAGRPAMESEMLARSGAVDAAPVPPPAVPPPAVSTARAAAGDSVGVAVLGDRPQLGYYFRGNERGDKGGEAKEVVADLAAVAAAAPAPVGEAVVEEVRRRDDGETGSDSKTDGVAPGVSGSPTIARRYGLQMDSLGGAERGRPLASAGRRGVGLAGGVGGGGIAGEGEVAQGAASGSQDQSRSLERDPPAQRYLRTGVTAAELPNLAMSVKEEATKDLADEGRSERSPEEPAATIMSASERLDQGGGRGAGVDARRGFGTSAPARALREELAKKPSDVELSLKLGAPVVADNAPAPASASTLAAGIPGLRAVEAEPESTMDSLAAEGAELQLMRKAGKAGKAAGLSLSDEGRKQVLKRVPAAPEVEREVLARENAFSTFSLNVSDVSYRLAAAALEKGQLPDGATIRSEEFLNAFDYRDPQVTGSPLSFAWDRARYPYLHNREVLRVALKTSAKGRGSGSPLNVVVLLDNSGSMTRADRVRIVRECLRVLAGKLGERDRLSVVGFARTSRLWVDGVPGEQAVEAVGRLGELTPEGGTNLEEALKAGYERALHHFIPGGINRVVLLTDGAANLGEVDPTALRATVEDHRRRGVALDCFGVGWEGLNDDLLEVLSRHGDGRHGFVNTAEQAMYGFAGQLAGALEVAASDVKVQVEFNPARVVLHRQVGYVRHQLTKQQFRDNTVDAAELGASETGNALYILEVNPQGQGMIGVVRARYKVPGTSDYREMSWVIPYAGPAKSLEQAPPALRLAVAATGFAEFLAGSPWAAEITTDRLLSLVAGLPEVSPGDPRPSQLEWMIRQAKSLSGR